MMNLKATRNNWTTTNRRGSSAGARSSSSSAASQSGIPWTRRPSRVVTMAPPPSMFGGNYNSNDIYSIYNHNNNNNNNYNTNYNNKKRMMTAMLIAMAGVAVVAMIVNVHFARHPSSPSSSLSSSKADDEEITTLLDSTDAYDLDETMQSENEQAQLQDLKFATQTGSIERQEYVLAKQRYLKANPPGHRQHPSYYSHTYMRQSKNKNALSIMQQWGAWTLIDDKERPVDKFIRNQNENHDWPLSKFPEGSWQTDTEYLTKFLHEALILCVRAKEAILMEYGLDATSYAQRMKVSSPDQVSLVERSRPFSMQLFNAETEKFPHDKHGDRGPLNEGGWMSIQTMASLKRRLLHAIMTQGSFTMATVGHQAAAGHGNHFQQSYPLQAGRILEPILARLGVKGKSHNLAMGVEVGHGGTLPFALGANDIIGQDVDVLIWDAKDADDQENDIGLFATQTLLSGRAPILMFAQNVHPVMQTLIDDNRKQFQGAIPLVRLGSGTLLLDQFIDMVNTTQDADAQQPWSMRYLKCGSAIGHYCQIKTYNATCWLHERNGGRHTTPYLWDGDLELPQYTPPRQQAVPPDRVGWNPGWRRHLLQSRVLVFTILQALHEALSEWKEQPNYLLPDDAWHVTNHYSQISTAISQSTATDQWCIGKALPLAFCRVVMHARTEYTPRESPWKTSLRSIIKAAGVVPQSAPNAYDPPDVDNPYLQNLVLDDSSIDVLAIVENGVDFQPNLARKLEAGYNEQAYSLAQQAATAAQTMGQSVNPEIKGGFGWELHSVASDNCDGTYNSFCNRGPTNNCLLAGYNDGKYGLLFDGYSGWMVFSLNIEHNTKQGVIVVSMNDQHASRLATTEGWCSENNTTQDCPSTRHRERRLLSPTSADHERQRQRQLVNEPLVYCADFKFEFAIDGQITSWNLTEFQQRQVQVQKDFHLWTLASGGQDDALTNAILSQTGQTVELAIRTTGCGRDKVLELTHVYWA